MSDMEGVVLRGTSFETGFALEECDEWEVKAIIAHRRSGSGVEVCVEYNVPAHGFLHECVWQPREGVAETAPEALADYAKRVAPESVDGEGAIAWGRLPKEFTLRKPQRGVSKASLPAMRAASAPAVRRGGARGAASARGSTSPVAAAAGAGGQAGHSPPRPGRRAASGSPPTSGSRRALSRQRQPPRSPRSGDFMGAMSSDGAAAAGRPAPSRVAARALNLQ